MNGESSIYHSNALLCSLEMDGPLKISKKGPLFVFRMQADSKPGSLNLETRIFEPRRAWFWWPNHEGERGLLSEVYDKLETLEGVTRGLSVLYPTSAFCRSLIVGDGEGGIILCAVPDEKGHTSKITIRCRGRKKVEFAIKTGRSTWVLAHFRGGAEEALDMLGKIMAKGHLPLLPKAEPSGQFLLQAGLIGPDYNCDVPPEQGFMVLENIASLMKHRLGKGQWLHVFGYSHGHDILYPDYSPSHYLGGAEKLEKAMEAVHRLGQKLSFYMNLRMADVRQVENDFELKQAVFLDAMKKQVIESYHQQKFVVMDSENPLWQKRILTEARRLADLGADALELNYRGLHPLQVALGHQWGGGLRYIMEEIHGMGLKIWYRGGTDIYPADWLELSREETVKDGEGHILSGCHLGQFDPRLYMAAVPGRAYLSPLSRGPFPCIPETGMMKDLSPMMEDLALYNKDYMENAALLMEKAVSEKSFPAPERSPDM